MEGYFLTEAFVLIKVKSGTEKTLFDTLFTVPEIQEAHTITGDYDLIAVMNAKEDDWRSIRMRKSLKP